MTSPHTPPETAITEAARPSSTAPSSATAAGQDVTRAAESGAPLDYAAVLAAHMTTLQDLFGVCRAQQELLEQQGKLLEQQGAQLERQSDLLGSVERELTALRRAAEGRRDGSTVGD